MTENILKVSPYKLIIYNIRCFVVVLLILVTQIKVVAQTEEFSKNDLDALKNIRDYNSAFSYVPSKWIDDTKAGSWLGVTWDNSVPKRVIKLNIKSSSLDIIDVEKLDKLEELDCSSNKVKSLKLNTLINLTSLNVEGNNLLTSLNVDSSKKLKQIKFGRTAIENISIKDLPLLEGIDCNQSHLKTVKFENLPLLRALICSDNDIEVLELRSLTNLVGINCNDNLIKKLDLTGLSKLEVLQCINNEMETLTFSDNMKLYWLECYDNMLEYLNLSNLSSLQTVRCEGNKLKHIEVNGLTNLKEFDCASNYLPFSELYKVVALKIQGLDYNYIPQGKINFKEEVGLGQSIDLSTEAKIGDKPTRFRWYLNYKEIMDVDQSGKFAPKELGTCYCYMTNNLFPGLNIYSKDIQVKNLTDISSNSINPPYLVYPNPANDQLFIEISTPMKDAFCQLITTDGKNMGIYLIENPKHTIDIANLKSGVYILKISNGGNCVVQKILRN
ncbi:MAG: T9SS type A sorting domain-containing protein [Prolixibacteraceae bacterium]|nr:T9SS type A sorting domain-containing protein [Prolixibacteraceae bacterium]